VITPDAERGVLDRHASGIAVEVVDGEGGQRRCPGGADLDERRDHGRGETGQCPCVPGDREGLVVEELPPSDPNTMFKSATPRLDNVWESKVLPPATFWHQELDKRGILACV